MKKMVFAIAALAGLAITAGCSDNYGYDLNGEGNAVFSYTFSNDVKTASRASADELKEQLAESAILWISKSNGDSGDGAVRKYKGLASIPAGGVKLAGGNYVAELWAGDSVSASFDKKYYKARVPFTISSGATQVELCGRIANVVASVNYNADVNDVLTDYTMTIGHDRGSLTFDDPDNQKGYFMMPSTDKNLSWTLTGKKNDGSQYTRKGVIENVKPCTEYILNVKCTPTSSTDGAAFIEIVIDETEIPVEDNITIILPPTISGYGFDIASPIYAPAYGVGRKSVYIAAATAQLSSLVIKSQLLNQVVGGDDVDLLHGETAPSVLESLRSAGINWTYNKDLAGEHSNIKINFEEAFMNKLGLGDYDIQFTATDSEGNVSSATMRISISEAKVIANQVADDDPSTWATSAVLTADIAASDATNYAIEYRQLGSADWIRMAPTATVGSTYTVNLTGLQPGTTYEYRAVCDDFAGSPLQFTTEAAAQIPNGGFEDWSKPGKPYLLYVGDEANMFWDSGNHGSSTLNKNVTEPASDVKHSGTYSAKLKSQYVSFLGIGKFAAGNAFVGDYLKTDGTDGELGFGREFTSRPKSLRLWIKYRPVAVTHEKTDKVPDLPKGAMDEGIVYFALTDGSVMDAEYPDFPMVVKTKGKGQFFDAERRAKGDVIAYGEKRIVGETSGEDMIELVVPFDYYKLDAKAKYLIVCIAASRGGDYFVGGDGSTMWVDDVELIYE